MKQNKLFKLWLLAVILFAGSGMTWGANLINENIQSWTNQGAYGNYTQGITAGTVSMENCIVANAATATGTCSAGRVQMRANNGIIELPALSTVGTAVFHMAAGAAGRSIKLQKFNGSTWDDLTTFSGIGTTGATFTYNVNSSSSTTLRLSSPSSALYVHDIIVTDYAGSAPTTQASNITFSNIGQNGMTAGWTNGDGAKRVVIMNTSNSFTAPTDGTDPTATTAYSGSGEQVVYNGSGNSVAVTGLTASTTYWFRVYEYNGSGATTKYLTTTGTNNPNSQITNALTPTITVTEPTVPALTAVVGGTPDTETINISGSNLTGDITFGLSGTNAAMFSHSPTTLPSSGGVLTITYTPTASGPHTATLTISSADAADVTRTLNGTATLAVPVATNASGISTTGFTANWGAVSGATGYSLDVSEYSTFMTTGTLASDLFISEYSEGTNNNKYIEIYNGTGSDVDLSQYSLKQSFEGYGWDYQLAYTLPLSGTLANNDVYIICASTASSTILAQADQTIAYSSSVYVQGGRVIYFTGNDAMGLFKNNILIDVFGNPASSATISIAGGAYGDNHTVVRKSSVTGGNTNWTTSSGTDTSSSEWIVNAVDVTTYLGAHTMTNSGTPSYVTGYNGLAVSGLSQVVSGLTNHTNYYYRVRAVGANGTSANSNVITVYTGENYRSKTNGNWNDLSTWEVSSDNNTWANASVVPAIGGAANISIGNGHLITVTENTSADLVTIQPTGKLTVNDGITLTVSEGKTIKLQSDETGTATLVGNVGGNAIVEQAVESSRNYYVGVPIDGAVVPTGIGNKVATFTESTDLWTDYTAAGPLTSAVAGQGYLVQVPSTSQLISFSGTLNNGDKSATLSSSKRRFNFLGNPYPSYVDGGVLLNGLTVEQTLWYYSKEGTGYTFKTVNTSTNVSTDDVDKRIAPMQGFWVRANVGTTPTVSFKNTNRMHKPTDGNANIGFRAPQATDYQMLRLQVSNNTLKDVAIVMFSENSTSDWSSSKMMNPSLNVYTLVNGNELAINSNTAIPYDVETTVGLQAPAGEYTISATEFSNFSTDKVYLLDKLTGISTDLSSGGSYTVNLTADYKGTDRFALVFPRTGVPTGLESAAGTTFAFIRNNRVVVNSDALGSTVYVFNGVGQQVASQAITGATTEVSKTLSAGVYVVKVNNDTVKVVVK